MNDAAAAGSAEPPAGVAAPAGVAGPAGVPEPAACANCGAALYGHYCHACGQDATAHVTSLRGFLAENLSDLAHFDSRGLRSLRDLLIRPGRLTAAYFRGQRVRFLTPVQIYLIAAALFFLANSVRPFAIVDGETWTVRSSLGVMAVTESFDEQERVRLIERGMTAQRFEDRTRATFNQQLPGFLIAVVVAFGLLVALMHPLRERNLLKHLVFALHFTALYLLVMIVERALGGPAGEPNRLSAVLGLVVLIWLAVALRKTYGQRWLLVAPKTLVLFLTFHILLAAWVGGVMALALARA